MTQDEVDLIYDYLHENYEYRDGELIARTKRCGPKVGRAVGSVLFSSNKGRSEFVATLRINKKPVKKTMSSWIYIYHNKKSPGFIKHVDGNPSNNKIENLYNFCQENKKIYRCCFVLSGNKKMYVGYVYTRQERDLISQKGKQLYRSGITDKIIIKKEIKKLFPQIRNRPVSYSGLRGVEKNNGDSRWQARITFGGIRRSLGTYDTPEEAHAAYLKAKQELTNQGNYK